MTSAAAYGNIGVVPMPLDFRRAEIFLRGRPRHGIPGRISTYDAFYRKHPPMDTARRAKIFAPFDALRGFNEAVSSKEILYEERRELTESEKEELDRRLGNLLQMTAEHAEHPHGRIPVRITYFLPCRDPEHEAFGRRGTYRTVAGSLLKIDFQNRTILLNICSRSIDTAGTDASTEIIEIKDILRIDVEKLC